MEAAHGRIMDVDVALESTRLARHSVKVQASAAMVAQANQMSAVALSLTHQLTLSQQLIINSLITYPGMEAGD